MRRLLVRIRVCSSDECCQEVTKIVDFRDKNRLRKCRKPRNEVSGFVYCEHTSRYEIPKNLTFSREKPLKAAEQLVRMVVQKVP